MSVSKESRICSFVLLFVGLLFLGFLIIYAGTKEVLSLMYDHKSAFIVVALCEISILLIWSLRWLYITRYAGVSLTREESLVLTGALSFVNNITPLDRSGGELVKVYGTKKYRKDASTIDVGSALVCEKIIETSLVVSLLFVFLVYFLGKGAPIHFLEFVLITIISTVFIVLCFVFIFHRSFLTSFFRNILKKLGVDATDAHILSFKEKTKGLITSKKASLSCIITSSLYWIVEFFRPFFVLVIFGENPLFHKVVISLLLANVFSSFSGIPGGVGAQESIRVVLYTNYVGIPLDIAVSAVLIERIAPLIIALICGFCVTSLFGMKKISLIERSKKESVLSLDQEGEHCASVSDS